MPTQPAATLPVPPAPELYTIDPLSALQFTTGDLIMDAKIQALNNLHEAKVRSLMRSVNSLKEEVAYEKSKGKEHRRSSLIASLRTSVKSAELVQDVLKEELLRVSSAASVGPATVEEVNMLVIKRSVGGPKRFRPKSREELQNEVIELSRKVDKETSSKAKWKEEREALRAEKASLEKTVKEMQKFAASSERSMKASAEDPSSSRNNNSRDLQGQVSELLELVESLKLSLHSRELNLTSQAEELDRMRSSNRELRVAVDRLTLKEVKYRESKDRLRVISNEVEKLGEENEVLKAQSVQDQRNLTILREEAKIDEMAMKDALTKQAEDLAASLNRERELADQLERYRNDSIVHRQQSYESLRGKDSALLDATKQVNDLRKKNESLENKLEKLSRDARDEAEIGKENAVQKEKLRSEGEKRKELQRRVTDLEKRVEAETTKRETAESELAKEKEKNKERDVEIKRLKKDGEKSAKASSATASKEEFLEAQVKELKDSLKIATTENGKLKGDSAILLHGKKDAEKRAMELEAKVAESERTKEYAVAITKMAAKTDSGMGDLADMGDFITQKREIDAKVKEIEDENSMLKEKLKEMKKKSEATTMLKNKQALALEKATTELRELRRGGGGAPSSQESGEIDNLKLLLKGAEIERDTSETKLSRVAEEIQSNREEVLELEKKITASREVFVLKLKQLEQELKQKKSGTSPSPSPRERSGALADFVVLRDELESAYTALSEQKAHYRKKIRHLQSELDAHADAVPLLKEISDKYRSYAELLKDRLQRFGDTDTPVMPELEIDGLLEDYENVSLDLSESDVSRS